MQLQILREPCLRPDGQSPSQHVVATYKPADEIVIVDCEMDIVTLGIVCEVLKSQYNMYLKKLKPSIANEIKQTIEKVFLDERMSDIEKYRNKAPQ